jgi:trans-2,3-dihydro-3-hydroxyanthranilate isomerase
MRIAFRLVDVFTDRPFAGNQLCVVPETPPGLDGRIMQTLAREIGFSETTFVTEAGGDRYSMRIFTPGQELPFAGHPTIGTAFVLVSEGRVRPRATQIVAAGEIPVEVDVSSGTARMHQLPPTFGAEFGNRELAAKAAGLTTDDLRNDVPMQIVSTGLPHLIVPVRSLGALEAANRDGPRVGEVCRATGGESMYLFAETSEGVTARMFDWELGVGEDPATGSAAGPLGAYLAFHGLAGMPGHITVAQGERVGRPSFLHVDVEPEADGWTVQVGGGVRVVGDGAFELP